MLFRFSILALATLLHSFAIPTQAQEPYPKGSGRVGTSQQIFQGFEPYAKGSLRLSGSEQAAEYERMSSSAPVRSRSMFGDADSLNYGGPRLEVDTSKRLDAREPDSIKLRQDLSGEARQILAQDRGIPSSDPNAPAFNFQKNIEEYRELTGWWAGAKIAFQDNQLVQGWKNNTAPSFQLDPEYRRFDDKHIDYVRSKGITDTDTVARITSKAVSGKNLDYLIQDEMRHRENNAKLQEFIKTKQSTLAILFILALIIAVGIFGFLCKSRLTVLVTTASLWLRGAAQRIGNMIPTALSAIIIVGLLYNFLGAFSGGGAMDPDRTVRSYRR